MDAVCHIRMWHLWPVTDPLGRFVVIDDIEREVVGMVRGTHH